MSISVRLLLLAAFVWVGIIIFSEAAKESRSDNPDKSKVVMLFGGAILDGMGIAAMVALTVIPVIGETIGAFLFTPGGKIEHDAHAGAIAKLAQGDPEGAIEDYQAILAKDPADTLALSEIARICCRDLGDTARAATVIEQALETEWAEEQSSFLANRLADIYLLQDDPMRARHVMLQVAENMDGTKYAANAQHRLHDIERAIALGAPASGVIEEGAQAPEAEGAEPSGEDPGAEG